LLHILSIYISQVLIEGIEAGHNTTISPQKLITKFLGAVVYFADPYASWQKGAIENTNKLIRQYIPKQANFDDFTDKKMQVYRRKSTVDLDKS